MPSAGGARRRMDKQNSSLMFMQVTPPHAWKEDSRFHYLRLTLPGFKTQDVTIHMDKYGHLVVRGDRQISEHKHMSFEETFDVPNNGELEDANGAFEDEQVYCITIPKKQQQQQQKQQERPGFRNDTKSKDKKKPNDAYDLEPHDDKKTDSLRKKNIVVFMIGLALLALVVGLVIKFRRGYTTLST